MNEFVAEFMHELQVSLREVGSLALNAVQALIVLLVLWVVARFFQRRLAAGMRRANVDPTVVILVGNIVLIVAGIVCALITVSLFGGNWTALVAFLSAGTVAVSLALQDVLKGFVDGVYLLVERPFSVGDRIRVKESEGIVTSVDLRTTTLRTDDAGDVIVPNTLVFSDVIANRTTSPIRSAVIEIAGIDLQPVDAVGRIEPAISGIPGIAGRARIDHVVQSGEGVAVGIFVPYTPGSSVLAPLAQQLAEVFPGTTVTVKRQTL